HGAKGRVGLARLDLLVVPTVHRHREEHLLLGQVLVQACRADALPDVGQLPAERVVVGRVGGHRHTLCPQRSCVSVVTAGFLGSWRLGTLDGTPPSANGGRGWRDRASAAARPDGGPPDPEPPPARGPGPAPCSLPNVQVKPTEG